jgi:uncharacterized protein YqfA (UPF0365 family)
MTELTEPTREIIGEYLLNALIIVLLFLTIHYKLPADVWISSWAKITVLGIVAMGLNILAFVKSLYINALMKTIDELLEVETDDEADKKELEELDKELN